MGEDRRLEEPPEAALPEADARLAEDIAALCGLSFLLAQCTDIPPSTLRKEIGHQRDEINSLLKQLMDRHRLTTDGLLTAAARVAARLYPLKTDKG